MEPITEANPSFPARRSRRLVTGFLLVMLAGVVWIWHRQSGPADAKKPAMDAVSVVVAPVRQGDVSVRLTANGTVSAQQTVAVRPQLSAMVSAVHIREGQYVQKGERLFTLDARTEDANLLRTKGQLAKSLADLRNAERNLERQEELFRQNFISQAALDVAQSQVEALRAQLAIDEATVQANRVARGFTEIVAPIAGRTGAIPVYQGSLVQPNDALVSITQIDPINVSFTLPERELASLQEARAKGDVPVKAEMAAFQERRSGRLIFIDNAVDTASGTIRLKAEFPNADRHLWPGMFVTVTLAPRTIQSAFTVPVQAVQNGPEQKFIYVIGEGSKANVFPVNVRLIQDGLAVIEGIGVTVGMRVVVEGAQNLRPGSTIVEAEASGETQGTDSNTG